MVDISNWGRVIWAVESIFEVRQLLRNNFFSLSCFHGFKFTHKNMQQRVSCDMLWYHAINKFSLHFLIEKVHLTSRLLFPLGSYQWNLWNIPSEVARPPPPIPDQNFDYLGRALLYIGKCTRFNSLIWIIRLQCNSKNIFRWINCVWLKQLQKYN